MSEVIHMDSNLPLKIESMELEQVKNEYGDDYFLNVSIITNDEYKKVRYTTKFKLPLQPAETSICVDKDDSTTLILNFGKLVCVGEPKIDVTFKKKQDMTIEEIEKKLGYKVRIVNEK